MALKIGTGAETTRNELNFSVGVSFVTPRHATGLSSCGLGEPCNRILLGADMALMFCASEIPAQLVGVEPAVSRLV